MGKSDTPLIPTFAPHAPEERTIDRWTLREAWSWVISLLVLTVFILVLVAQERHFSLHVNLQTAKRPVRESSVIRKGPAHLRRKHIVQPFVSPVEIYRPDQHPSRLVGGVPGYTIWDNVWFHDDEFYAFVEESQVVGDIGQIISGGSHFRVIRRGVAKDEIDDASTLRRLEGVTIFVNDRLSDSPSSYYHLFAESLLGAFATLSSVQARETRDDSDLLADRLVIPHDYFWADESGMSERVGTAIFNETSRLIFEGEWDVLTKTKWNQKGSVLLDRVIIVDHRATLKHSKAAHNAHSAAVAALNLPRPADFLDAIQTKLYSSLDTSHSIARSKPGKAIGLIPKVVYFDIQSSTAGLLDSSHKGLLEILMSLASEGLASTVHLPVDLMASSDLLEMISNADIIVGLHGTALTHTMWMPRGGKVVEIFPRGTFSPEIAVLSEVIAHEHIVVRGDKVTTKSWESISVSRKGLSSNEPIEIDVKRLERLLRKTVKQMRNV